MTAHHDTAEPIRWQGFHVRCGVPGKVSIAAHFGLQADRREEDAVNRVFCPVCITMLQTPGRLERSFGIHGNDTHDRVRNRPVQKLPDPA